MPHGSDLVLHLTEWTDYRAIDPAALRRIVAGPVLIDGRCTLDATAWRQAGWTVLVPGRPAAGELQRPAEGHALEGPAGQVVG
jgi:UDPglucose 6-dehydrogenase